MTNHTGVDAQGRSSVDLLLEHPEVELVALYSPEHGFRGAAEAGELVDHTRDQASDLPIHSLYGETRKPTPAMLSGLDLLIFDIQDIGSRFYTYIYTMSLAMEAAGEAGIPFLVLDRPNPLGGELIQGNVLDPAFSSFVGLHPLPIRHGMTPGELALLFRDRFGVEADLTVIPMDGWRRSQLLTETRLPWIPPSPNMPSLESAQHYPGTCLFEGTNLSVGRGTEMAFQVVGAPWLDGQELTQRMNALDPPGVVFHPVRFTPQNPGDGKFPGEEVGGVRLEVTNVEVYNPVTTAALLLREARALSDGEWRWIPSHFDRLAGTDELRETLSSGEGVDMLMKAWQAEAEAFRGVRTPYLLYP
ncbi:MAG: DUF1343 domain-containing protein [Gemmatimonadota bacterium]